MYYTLRSSQQAKTAPGNMAVSLLRDSDNTYWTRTVWTTDSAVKAFMVTGTHRQVMRKLLDWCDEASLVRWEQGTDQEPDWEEAHRRMQAEGRRSKVNYPSPAHEKFEIRPPKLPV